MEKSDPPPARITHVWEESGCLPAGWVCSKPFLRLPEGNRAWRRVIADLSPDHEPSMAQLLLAYTGVNLMQVAKQTEITADCVYLIPPKGTGQALKRNQGCIPRG